MEETLTAKIQNLQNDIKKKDETLATRDNEINDYKSKIADNVKQIGELELANRKTKEETASHVKRAEELAGRSQAKITALESQLKETEEFARQKESTIKAVEQQLAAKVQEFESMVNDKQALLTRQDLEINDLKSQLKRLTKGIGEMSSFFRQAEALTAIEEKAASTAAQNGPIDRVEEKPAVVQSNIARVTVIVPEAAGEIVPPEIFQQIISELSQATNVMGSLSALIVRRQAKALGESMEKFPRKRLPELLEGLVKEISDENRRIDFRQRLAQSAQITLN
jgi:chromosome segregation ATPase